MLVAGLLGVSAPAAHAGLSWNVASFDFGEQEVGLSSPAATFTLTATCDAATLGVCNAPAHAYGSVGAPGTDFNVDSTTCDGLPLLTPLESSVSSCTARVAFKPSAKGLRTGVLQTGTGQTVALSGTGVEAGSQNNDGSGAKKCKKKKKGKSSASAAKKKKKCKKKKKK